MLKNSEASDDQLATLVVSRLVLNEESLEEFSIAETRHVFQWALDNLLSQKIMPVEQWLETAFHLCKQRWDASIEWMETLPVPKILLMIDIVNRFIKEQEAEMKKSSRRKK
jgi:hypothetical protein